MFYYIIILVLLVVFFLFRKIFYTEKFTNNFTKLQNYNSLESKLKEKTLVVILAPWCGFCKKLKESGVLIKISKKIFVIEIDDKHPQVKDIMDSANSEGFPTIILYKNNNFYKYKGDRSYNSILKFIETV